MWRFLLLLSILPIVVSLLARWWFGKRVLLLHAQRECSSNHHRWKQALGDAPLRSRATAQELGAQLHLQALADWHAHAPKQAAAREGARRFGYAVPPLSLMVACFAVLLAKIPVVGGISIVIAATALAAALHLLSLGAELRAIAHSARKLKECHALPRSEEEEAVIACAIAQAWEESGPPILRLLQK